MHPLRQNFINQLYPRESSRSWKTPYPLASVTLIASKASQQFQSSTNSFQLQHSLAAFNFPRTCALVSCVYIYLHLIPLTLLSTWYSWCALFASLVVSASGLALGVRGRRLHTSVASNLGNKFNWPGAQIKMVGFYGGSNQRILTSGNMGRNFCEHIYVSYDIHTQRSALARWAPAGATWPPLTTQKLTRAHYYVTPPCLPIQIRTVFIFDN
jgi:hypothetical protein